MARYEDVSSVLDGLDDDQMRGLLEGAVPLGAGIGGTTLRVDIDGVPAFVKCLSLTDLEQREEVRGSTANCFDLPAFCHYGIGSPGFGVWRELAMLTKTTDAVLAGSTAIFPLTYHWRVLPGVTIEPSAELRDVDAAVAFWEHSPAVRARLQALREASAVVAIFQEYIPLDLRQWLSAEVQRGDGAVDTALRMVDVNLRTGVRWMNAHGWLHLDAHFENIQTDGQNLYFADFGLALAQDFDLSPEERVFVDGHASYDESYVLTQFTRWLVAAFCGGTIEERDAVIETAARGAVPSCLPPSAAAMVVRYAPVAAVVMPFYRRLQSESLHAPYPDLAVQRVLDNVT